MSDHGDYGTLFGGIAEWVLRHPGRVTIVAAPIHFPITYTRAQERTGRVTESDVGRPDD